ncbi:MAG: Gfo/Idh/MocA family oxidoreductase [Halobacteriovoraceae bacterium]|nr:Gfo/Idh/MocA family oxidoreductase [Halobacteriovoraceae bacterium]
MKNFSLIGIAGYIAPRHLKAIKETNNDLLASYDPFDSVGIIDRYFPNAEYFNNFEQFTEFHHKNPIDYVTVCSPNYLHKEHTAFALRHGSDVICEKPLVLHNSELDELAELEEKTGKRVYTILQLRVHDAIKNLKAKIESENRKEKYDVNLSYITTRGSWFHRSWKGDIKKSGGLATNVGIHFFDMLTWLFGSMEYIELHAHDRNVCTGFVELEHARVKWFLSVDKKYLPQKTIESGGTTFRSITIDNEEIEFSNGFTDLHTMVYQDILDGKGYGIEAARRSIRIVEEIRLMNIQTQSNNFHSLFKSV